MRDPFSSLLYHVILSTEGSNPPPDLSAGSPLTRELDTVVQNLGGRVAAAGGTDDHVHLLAELPAEIAVWEAAERLTGESEARIQRLHGPGAAFRWKGIAGLFSVSRAASHALETYIRNQREHHRCCSFEQELREFAEREQLPPQAP